MIPTSPKNGGDIIFLWFEDGWKRDKDWNQNMFGYRLHPLHVADRKTIEHFPDKKRAVQVDAPLFEMSETEFL